MTYSPTITDFHIVRPEYEISQEACFEWLQKAHTAAEKKKNQEGFEEEKFSQLMKQAIARFSCKQDRIKKRGHITSDFCHENWEEMQVYRLNDYAEGLGLGKRSQLYAQFSEEILQKFYPENTTAPDDLIHVTCTGYNCPSAAQKLVSKRLWNEKTTVTHAYHMGCMAAMPAIRIGMGFLTSSNISSGKLTGNKKQIDIVHTEMCSLHLNPTLHSPDQLVGQSLFSDGFIKYSLRESHSKGLKILKIQEEILANSTNFMGWECEDWGFYFTLSKEIPNLIRSEIGNFIKRLLSQTNYTFDHLCQKAIFAIHPGGPKIIDRIREQMNLSKEQVAISEEILFNYGNMSSATLPHIWERIANDNSYPSGALIIGLAFAPGLTMCGILLEKI